MDKAQAHPLANKDELGRLRVAAATGVGRGRASSRARALIAAEVDVIVVDTAHGHSARRAGRGRRRSSALSNAVQVIAGNVATPEGALALIEAGADAVKIGIGPGSICTTRVVAGVGVPQFTAVLETAAACRERGVPAHRRRRHAHLGRHRQGDRRRGRLRDDRQPARRHRRGAGRSVPLSGALLQILPRHGQHRRDGARLGRPLFPAGHQGPVEAGARRAWKAASATRDRSRRWCTSWWAALRAGMGYTGSATIADLQRQARFRRVTGAGLRESHVHDVAITREAPNYRQD